MDIDIDGLSVCYTVTGTGPRTAVILQGWGTSMKLYEPIAADLSDAYRVISFDFPGFGASEEPPEAWPVSRYADFTEHFLTALGIRSVVLIAHSYGGRVTIELASRKTSFTIERIVLVDSAGILPVKTKKQLRQQRRYKILKKIASIPFLYAMFQDYIDDWRGRQGSADYRNATPVMKKALVMAVNDDQTEKLPLIQAPTLLIWGDVDTATPIRDAHIMEEKIPDAGLCVLQGCGHFAFLQKPAEFRRILRSFLIGEGGRPCES